MILSKRSEAEALKGRTSRCKMGHVTADSTETQGAVAVPYEYDYDTLDYRPSASRFIHHHSLLHTLCCLCLFVRFPSFRTRATAVQFSLKAKMYL